MEATSIKILDSEGRLEEKYQKELLIAVKRIAGQILPRLEEQVEVEHIKRFSYDYPDNTIYVLERGPGKSKAFFGLVSKDKKTLLFKVQAHISNKLEATSYRPGLDELISQGLGEFCQNHGINSLVIEKEY